jgi:hypothetical protein
MQRCESTNARTQLTTSLYVLAGSVADEDVVVVGCRPPRMRERERDGTLHAHSHIKDGSSASQAVLPTLDARVTREREGRQRERERERERERG